MPVGATVATPGVWERATEAFQRPFCIRQLSEAVGLCRRTFDNRQDSEGRALASGRGAGDYFLKGVQTLQQNHKAIRRFGEGPV